MTHSDSPATPANDPAELRRSLRDVVALTMLPTVWAGYEPRQICVDFVDVVARMVDADGVYLTSPTNDCPEILRLKREGDGETERALRAAAAEATIGHVQIVTKSGEPPFTAAGVLAVVSDRRSLRRRRAPGRIPR